MKLLNSIIKESKFYNGYYFQAEHDIIFDLINLLPNKSKVLRNLELCQTDMFEIVNSKLEDKTIWLAIAKFSKKDDGGLCIAFTFDQYYAPQMASHLFSLSNFDVNKFKPISPKL